MGPSSPLLDRQQLAARKYDDARQQPFGFREAPLITQNLILAQELSALPYSSRLRHFSRESCFWRPTNPVYRASRLSVSNLLRPWNRAGIRRSQPHGRIWTTLESSWTDRGANISWNGSLSKIAVHGARIGWATYCHVCGCSPRLPFRLEVAAGCHNHEAMLYFVAGACPAGCETILALWTAEVTLRVRQSWCSSEFWRYHWRHPYAVSRNHTFFFLLRHVPHPSELSVWTTSRELRLLSGKAQYAALWRMASSQHVRKGIKTETSFSVLSDLYTVQGTAKL